VIGTSLQVYPAAGLVRYARYNVPVYLIDPNPVNADTTKFAFIQQGATEGVKELKRILGV
jgi:NAD-dependent deacetylase